jgi:hypothetical protein
MTTPRQAAARAENGRRHSTGPRTEEGKKASRMNAKTHGGYVTVEPVIAHGPLAEDPEAYAEFQEAVVSQYDAQGPVETQLCHQIASVLWRLRRPAAYEAIYLAQRPGSSPDFSLQQSDWLTDWNSAAIRALENPEGDHPVGDLEAAAIAAGHAAGIEMEDNWPQPRPTSSEGWYELIDRVLQPVSLTMDDVVRRCEAKIDAAAASRRAAWSALLPQEVKRIIDGDLLMKTAKVEAHLGRELSRHMALLRTLQGNRAEEEPE